MELKEMFDAWGRQAHQVYADQQHLLSKWEINEGIEWPKEKTDILINSLVEGLSPQREDVFIELGCGGGWIASALTPYFKESYGLDFSMEMLRAAVKRFHGKLVNADIAKLPVCDDSFDCVLSYYVFMNFTDDQYVRRSFSEIVRILKKGGRALIGQLPDNDGSQSYEQAKEQYVAYCQKIFKVGKSIREDYKPPLRLFDREIITQMLKALDVKFCFRNSFNPFYRPGQEKLIDWRFDIVITKN